MPYIIPERRAELDYPAPDGVYETTAGELNYSFSRMIQNYIDTKGLSYQTFNDIIGALEGAKLEFYRRKVVPYEEKKMAENGDVYE